AAIESDEVVSHNGCVVGIAAWIGNAVVRRATETRRNSNVGVFDATSRLSDAHADGRKLVVLQDRVRNRVAATVDERDRRGGICYDPDQHRRVVVLLTSSPRGVGKGLHQPFSSVAGLVNQRCRRGYVD